MIRDTQDRLMAQAIAPAEGRRVLDVGTGTGRAALGFARDGAVVTGIDASEEMLAVARRTAADRALPATFQVGDAHAIPFGDRTFDVAVSLRVIMHTPDWRVCVRELCRVSDWRVILDFPSARSVASIESALRRRRQARGQAVEAYRTLAIDEVVAEITTAGFRVVTVHKQFVLPINFHKLLNSKLVTTAIETTLATFGLLHLFGSPVTVVAERVK
jgi:SAM-dependent methyltransferase